MSERIETIILSNLINDEEFCRKTLPFLKSEYFSERSDKVVFVDIETFFSKYNKVPTQQILKIHLEDRTDMKQSEFDKALELVDTLVVKETNGVWLLERTEKFCKDQALYGAILNAIATLDGTDTKFTKEAIPCLLQDALAISFDKNVGHSYFDDAENRYDSYHAKEDKLPFGLDIFNKITKGGFSKKTLNVIMAGTGVGKSLFMCDYSASVLKQGKNVLYLTLEMSAEAISSRIDCHLLDVPMDDLYRMKKSSYIEKLEDIKSKSRGTLIVKEYPTAGAHSGHFKALVDELKTKKNFIPDVIVVDYLNICQSSRVKNVNAGSYQVIKSIAEELRGLAVECNVPILSATQSNREAQASTDIDLTNTSESIGLPQTVDWMLGLMRSEELDTIGQVLCKQLKSRYNDINYFKRFVVGVDISRFKLYDVDQPGANISDAGRTDDSPKGFSSSKTINVDGLDFS